MLNQIRPTLVMLALFSALTGLAYPLAITGLALEIKAEIEKLREQVQNIE